jgi:hypothetical protein
VQFKNFGAESQANAEAGAHTWVDTDFHFESLDPGFATASNTKLR